MSTTTLDPQFLRTVATKRVVDAATGCWVWTGAKDRHGYGRCYHGGKMHLAHRMAYIGSKGAISEGLELDHLCSNPQCINPDHLEAVTHGENIRRGKGNGLKHVTHCVHGHEYNFENTKLTAQEGGKWRRSCRACARIAGRNRYRAAHGIPLEAGPQKTGRKT